MIEFEEHAFSHGGRILMFSRLHRHRLRDLVGIAVGIWAVARLPRRALQPLIVAAEPSLTVGLLPLPSVNRFNCDRHPIRNAILPK